MAKNKAECFGEKKGKNEQPTTQQAVASCDAVEGSSFCDDFDLKVGKPAPDRRAGPTNSNTGTAHKAPVNASKGLVSQNQAVIDNEKPQKACVIDNANTSKIATQSRARLAELREEFRWRPGHEDWRARWWHGLTTDEKRTVFALCGVDDSVDSVKRSWLSLPYSVREAVSKQCRHWARVMEPMRWA